MSRPMPIATRAPNQTEVTAVITCTIATISMSPPTRQM